jgi:hypothetical protein
MLTSPRSQNRSTVLIPPFLLFTALLPLLAVPATAGTLCPEYVGMLAKEVASADFDNDGHADFAVTTEPNAVAIVLGQSGARPTQLFQTIPTGGAAFGIAAGDLNGDGNADLVVANPLGDYARVLLGHGDGTFSFGDPTDAGPNPYRMALADLDGDADLDLTVLRGSVPGASPAVTVRANAGDGTFGPSTTIELATLPVDSHADLAAGDLDGDGDADLVVSGSGISGGAIAAGFAVLRANGDGTFAPPDYVLTGVSIGAIAIGDVTGDGIGDLVSRDGYAAVGGPLPNRIAVYPGTAGGTLGAPIVSAVPTAAWGHGRLRLGDLDADGDLDAVVVSGPIIAFIDGCASSIVGTFLGDGAGGFLAAQTLSSGGHGSFALALGDATGDGLLDVATTGDDCGTLVLNPGSSGGVLTTLTHEARAFVDRHNEVIRLNSNKPNWCVSFEPVGGSFDLISETPYPRLVSVGTGSVDEIPLDSQKGIVIGDSDGNDVSDVRVCYAKDRLRQLFSGLSGRQSVTLTLRADIGTPASCLAVATVTVDVLAGGGNNAAAFAKPDAGRSGWTLSYRAERGAPVRVRLFDVSGRFVGSAPASNAVVGWNDVRIEARDAAGRALRSGVYFYKIDGLGDPITGRLVLAR